jgi:hypothetical protein
MFDEDIIMKAALAQHIRWLDHDKRLWVTQGKNIDVFCVDNGCGEAAVVATQPTSGNGEPTPEVMAFITQLLSLQKQALEESEADED